MNVKDFSIYGFKIVREIVLNCENVEYHSAET